MSRSPRRGVAAALACALAALVGLAACGGGGGGGGESAPAPAPARRDEPPPPPDPARVYRSMGLMAHGSPFPITGRVSYLATAVPESTTVVLTVSIPSRALTFTHAGDSYRAAYAVELSAGRGDSVVAAASARETVVVPTFRETARSDESVLFQRQLRLAPGSYQLRLAVGDAGSDRSAADSLELAVPRLDAGTLGTPVPYYEAVMRESLAAVPRLLAMPRATATFGQDSTLPVYVEGYAAAGGGERRAGGMTAQARVRGEGGVVAWRDSVLLAGSGGDAPGGSGGRVLARGVLTLPVAQLGIGAATLEVWADGGRDTVQAPLFVTFGEELPAATFADMLSYLRFFASPARLEELRRTPPAGRGAAWAAFLGQVGAAAGVSGEQALRQYFARIQVANQRYRDDGGAGWLSDRGMVFTAFGDADMVEEPGQAGVIQRSRVQLWIYRDRHLQLEFRDVTGFDHWRLTAQSEGAFRAALARLGG